MGAFVVLAVALMLAAAALVGVAALKLRRQATVLRSTLTGVRERIQPLLDELAAESAVIALELDAIRRTREASRDT